MNNQPHVLRDFLYKRLNRLYKQVKITNQGEPCSASTVPSPLSPKRLKLNVQSWGENYVINCPYCHDSRLRLYIGHLWGYYDHRTGTKNWWMIKCFNEDCFSSHERRMAFADKIFDESNLLSGCNVDVIKKGKEVQQHVGPPPMPGEVTLVSKLIPEHPAYAYLQSRGFDPIELGEQYEISYCTSATFPFSLALNRIIIPVKHESKLVGWQARFLGERPTWKTGVPKYFNLASKYGFRKSNVLYNLDNAREHKYVVLMEGPTDVWRYGPEAVASFGKSMSQQQLELVRLNFDRVVILLDGDAEADSIKLYEKLQPHVQKVLRIQLKEGLDPGGMTTEQLRNCVELEMKINNFLE